MTGIILGLATALAIGLGTSLYRQKRELYSADWEMGISPTEKAWEENP